MTIGVLAAVYPWTKALHVISLIAWLAGVFYLPRLFVYHCEVARGSVESERFKVMERRLLKQIMLPAMLSTWLLARQVVVRAADDRLPGRDGQVAAGFSGRPQPPAAAFLPHC
jgi:putative membrane protein